MVPTVLIVDDEKHTREGLQQALAEQRRFNSMLPKMIRDAVLLGNA